MSAGILILLGIIIGAIFGLLFMLPKGLMGERIWPTLLIGLLVPVGSMGAFLAFFENVSEKNAGGFLLFTGGIVSLSDLVGWLATGGICALIAIKTRNSSSQKVDVDVHSGR